MQVLSAKELTLHKNSMYFIHSGRHLEVSAAQYISLQIGLKKFEEVQRMWGGITLSPLRRAGLLASLNPPGFIHQTYIPFTLAQRSNGDQGTTANEHTRPGELVQYLNRYKSGTAKFITWLIEAVQSCGQSLAGITNVSTPSPAPFSKGAKRKAGKAAVNALIQTEQSKHLIPIRDFTKLVEVIVKSTKQKVQVPSSILALLDDVISFRKEYSRWVGQAAGGSQAQNETHLYFVSVLQQVKGILRRNDCALPQGRRPDGKENTDPREKEAANIFEALSLEEPEGAVDSLNLSFSISIKLKAKLIATSKPIYDVEFFYNEVLFFFCFVFPRP